MNNHSYKYCNLIAPDCNLFTTTLLSRFESCLFYYSLRSQKNVVSTTTKLNVISIFPVTVYPDRREYYCYFLLPRFHVFYMLIRLFINSYHTIQLLVTSKAKKKTWQPYWIVGDKFSFVVVHRSWSMLDL